MLDQEKIIQFLNLNGPSLPTKVAKYIDTQVLFASAHLADLSSQGKVKISSLKIGGSPLYYLAGQEEKLYAFAPGNVNPKDLQVLERLKKEIILQEEKLDLLSKVAVRNLKDFAVPLHVKAQGRTHLFWKWYVASDEETNIAIRNVLVPQIQAEMSEEAIVSKETIQKTLEAAPIAVVERDSSTVSMPKGELQEETAPAAAVSNGKTIEETRNGVKVSESEETKTNIKKEKKTAAKEAEEKKEEKTEETEELKKDVKKEKKSKGRKASPDSFLPEIESFFEGLGIKVQEHEVVRKGAEINMMVKVPSVVGEMTYFCKAKSKRRCDEKDISTAYMEAQIKKIPLLFLYKEQITAKALEMLETDAFENIVVKKLE